MSRPEELGGLEQCGREGFAAPFAWLYREDGDSAAALFSVLWVLLGAHLCRHVHCTAGELAVYSTESLRDCELLVMLHSQSRLQIQV